VSTYKLRMFTRPTNVGCGWRLFKAWRQHEGMDMRQTLLWYYPSCVEYIDGLIERYRGDASSPFQLPGFEVRFGEEE